MHQFSKLPIDTTRFTKDSKTSQIITRSIITETEFPDRLMLVVTDCESIKLYSAHSLTNDFKHVYERFWDMFNTNVLKSKCNHTFLHYINDSNYTFYQFVEKL